MRWRNGDWVFDLGLGLYEEREIRDERPKSDIERTSNCVPAVSDCRPSEKLPCGSSACGGGAPSAGGGVVRERDLGDFFHD